MSSTRELHVITSGRHSLDEVLRMAEAAYAGGMNFLHIREKQRTAKECMDWVKALANVIPLSSLIVNDRVDVAASSGCAGAHLAYHSLSPEQARLVLKPGQKIGRSVHSTMEAQLAVAAKVDYLLYGHIFASGSKPGLAPRGTAELNQMTLEWNIPIIGLGGITPELVAPVLDVGCAGIAVLSGITEASDAKAAALAYRKALDRWEGK
ncbi:thiamine phosphate synthase [Brevibacillus sp. 179-C9.3 HS]|uniref:thiamine phosphate synthase n=1 Tax=unclassified Brevibacillus TaxID=2684853 RepID=UPI0039A1D00D